MSQSATSVLGIQPDSWAVTHTPAENVVATITKAAVAGSLHICTGIICTLTSETGLIAAALGLVNLRDSTTGAGNILLSFRLSVAAVAGSAAAPVVIDTLYLPGVISQAMTLEFTAAGGVDTYETVALIGYTVRP